jgi:hypothetical protein
VPNSLDIILKDTRSILGDDADLSRLTEDLVKEARDNGQKVSILSGSTEGNTFMKDGNNWRWRKDCSPNPADWLYWGGNANATRNVNCANGLLHYAITWW